MVGGRAGSTVAQISSWDTTGGNDDGFGGTCSYLRKEHDRVLRGGRRHDHRRPDAIRIDRLILEDAR